jgi:basic amino acid/polyamine antiporter, APA family
MPLTTAAPEPAGSSPHGRLLAVLGLAFGISITIGSTAGIGILRSPSAIAAEMPSVWGYLALWAAGGAYALLVALTLAELALITERSGGPYVFVRAAFGNAAGFLTGWIDWVALCGIIAVLASVLGDYAVGILPELRAPEVIALLVVTLITLVHWLGVGPAAWLQSGAAVVKVAALLVFVGACMYLGTRDVSSMAFEPEREGSLLAALLVTFNAVIVTIHGSAAAVYFAGEIRNARRVLPRAVMVGVLTVLALYLLVNLSILKVVPLATIASREVAADVVADRLFGPDGAVMARILVVLALISAVSAAIMTAPRILHAMGSDGTLPRPLAWVNPRGTPEMGLLATVGLAAILIVSRAHAWVMTSVGLVFVVTSMLSLAAYVRLAPAPSLRRKLAMIGIVTSGVLIAGLVVAEPAGLVRVLAAALTGVVVLLIRRTLPRVV